MEACDQPTIESILDNYGLSDILGHNDYGNLLSALQDRDIVMRTDAAKYEAQKMFRKGLDSIIEQY